MATETRVQRYDEIDILKGVAILAVLLIHARSLVGTFVGDFLVNRAVQVLLVLFGVTSASWYQSRAAQGKDAGIRVWIRARRRRLLVPTWTAVAIWWCLYWLMSPTRDLGIGSVFVSILGYLPRFDTSWFVTLILELVLLFPLIYKLYERLSTEVALALAFVTTVLAALWTLTIIDILSPLLMDSAPGQGFFYAWIFPPNYAWHVVCGIALAKTGHLRDRALIGPAVIIICGGIAAYNTVTDSFVRNAIQAILDVPLTIVLLAAARRTLVSRSLATPLIWLGLSSWGIYLAQAVIYNGAEFAGMQWQFGSRSRQWGYFVLLLFGSVVLVHAGDFLRRKLAKL